MPLSMTKMRSFLGLENYFQSFMKGLSKIVAPYSTLLKGNLPLLIVVLVVIQVP